MTDRIPPMVPHLSPRVDKPNKTSRTIRIVLTFAAILVLGYYEIRVYYVAYIGPPEYVSKLKELEGTYKYSCNVDNAPISNFSLKPHPVFLPVITVSRDPFSISMPLQPPDGSLIEPSFTPMLHGYPPIPRVGYFYYESNKKIRVVSSDGTQLTFIPVRWHEANFLVRPEDVDTLCQDTIPDCYFYSRIRRLKGEPTYLDGAPICQQ